MRDLAIRGVVEPRTDDADLRLLREAVRGVLERCRGQLDGAVGGPATEALAAPWAEAARLGWTRLGRRDPVAGLTAAALVCEETGRAACPLPVAAATVTLLAAEHAPTEVRDRLDALLASGGVVAVGLGEAGGDAGGGRLRLRPGGDGLDGRLRFVEALPLASLVLCVAEPGPLLCLVETARVRVVLTPGLGVPPLGDVHCQGTPVAGSWEVSGQVLGDLGRVARLLTLARALGAARRSFDLAVDHARTRHQFGSPIGRFQAVQHRLADCLTLLDASALLLARATRSWDAGDDGWRRETAAATAFAAPALRRVAREAQHTLAGVGYIEEHEAPRHFRRVMADTVRYGGARAARSELLEAVIR